MAIEKLEERGEKMMIKIFIDWLALCSLCKKN